MVTAKDVERIAHLARIEIADDRKAKLAEELSLILGYIDKLKEVDTSDVEPTAQVTGLENIFRPDVEQSPDTVTAELIRQNMPAREGSHLKVKSVFGEK